jgi:hypothetical protein
MRIWIVVADEREALFYDAKGPDGPFDLALTLPNTVTGAVPRHGVGAPGAGLGSRRAAQRSRARS